MLLFVLSESNTRLVSSTVRVIAFQIGEQLAIILYGVTNGIVGSAKLIHKIF